MEKEGSGMPATVRCSRCGESKAALAAAPFGSDLGRRIQSAVCASCWGEWQAAQLNVINEHRISLRDQAGQDALVRHMKEFLKLAD